MTEIEMPLRTEKSQHCRDYDNTQIECTQSCTYAKFFQENYSKSSAISQVNKNGDIISSDKILHYGFAWNLLLSSYEKREICFEEKHKEIE